MSALVTLEDLDFQLRLDLSRASNGSINDPLAPKYEAIADRATAIVLRHVKRSDEPWEIAETPDEVKAAILIVARNLWDEHDEPLSPAVVRLLTPFRDPTLA